jgi:hypothetical protein
MPWQPPRSSGLHEHNEIKLAPRRTATPAGARRIRIIEQQSFSPAQNSQSQCRCAIPIMEPCKRRQYSWACCRASLASQGAYSEAVNGLHLLPITTPLFFSLRGAENHFWQKNLQLRRYSEISLRPIPSRSQGSCPSRDTQSKEKILRAFWARYQAVPGPSSPHCPTGPGHGKCLVEAHSARWDRQQRIWS